MTVATGQWGIAKLKPPKMSPATVAEAACVSLHGGGLQLFPIRFGGLLGWGERFCFPPPLWLARPISPYHLGCPQSLGGITYF